MNDHLGQCEGQRLPPAQTSIKVSRGSRGLEWEEWLETDQEMGLARKRRDEWKGKEAAAGGLTCKWLVPVRQNYNNMFCDKRC